MPKSEPLVDLASHDLTRVVVDADGVRVANPHRDAFEMLHGLLHFDPEATLAIGFHDVTEDEYWVSGHVPGRPLFPGVLQVETAAQVASYVYNTCFDDRVDGFFGFAGIDNVRFSGSVVPGDRFLVVARARRMKRRFAIFDTQGYVGNEMVCEAVIKGALV